MRIYVIGQSGSGKTTFAEKLSKKLHIRHVELDVVWFKHNEQREPFKDEVCDILNDRSWIVEGKHRTVRKHIMELADTIIYLDFPLLFSIKGNIERAIKNKENPFSFLKHLIKVIRQFIHQKRAIQKELMPHKKKIIVCHDREDLEELVTKNWFK